MLDEQDRVFIQDVGERLQRGMSMDQAADDLGINYNTLYQRVRRCGYRIERSVRLVPIHAPVLDTDHQAA